MREFSGRKNQERMSPRVPEKTEWPSTSTSSKCIGISPNGITACVLRWMREDESNVRFQGYEPREPPLLHSRNRKWWRSGELNSVHCAFHAHALPMSYIPT